MIASLGSTIAELETVIRAIAGVQTLFPATPFLKTVVTQFIASANPAHPENCRITVTEHDEHPTATIHLGVTGSVPTPQIAATVYDAAQSHFRAADMSNVFITIRIGSIS